MGLKLIIRQYCNEIYTQEVNKRLTSYKCSICGYVYDPEKGDPEGSIEPGTPFEDIPDDWVCPICGASKELFEELVV